MRLVVALSLLLCSIGPAAAQEAPAGAPAAEQVAAPTPPEPLPLAALAAGAKRPRSPATALGLSLGATAAGLTLLAGGLGVANTPGRGRLGEDLALAGAAVAILGPGLGHAYSGRWGRALAGVALRVGAPVAGALAGSAVAGARFDEGDRCGDVFPCGVGYMLAGFGAGLLVSVSSAAHDVATAPKSARESEERRGEREAARLSVAPLLRPGASALGLSLAGSF